MTTAADKLRDRAEMLAKVVKGVRVGQWKKASACFGVPPTVQVTKTPKF